MSRDHRKLRVFQEADGLVCWVYRLTRSLPMEERFGLQSQIRRAAVSTATNIVEGSARSTRAEYRRFLEIAHSSSREAGYLIDLSARLDLLDRSAAETIAKAYEGLAGGLVSLMSSLNRLPQSPLDPR